MAIRKTTVLHAFGQDVSVPDAYVRVSRIEGKARLDVRVAVLNTDATAHLHDLFYSFAPEMDGANFIAQAYEYLKTLPEFEGAVNC